VTGEEVFFREWRARRPGEARSLERAQELGERLRLFQPDIPMITVIGSKGKGTAATYASAYLAAAGQRVVTITSPGLRSNRERIRVDGRAVDDTTLTALARKLDAQMRDLSRHTGYLSPVGLFTLAGVLHARDIDADVLVVEAGRGGVSDEVGLFCPTVMALTSIFAEHLGEIGRSLDAIAIDKAGSVVPTTRAVVTLPQTAEVMQTIGHTVDFRSDGGLKPEVVRPLAGGLPLGLLADGLNRPHSELGIRAAQRLLDVSTHMRPEPQRVLAVLGSTRVPGRRSRHRVPGFPTQILVDSAINRAGIAAALVAAEFHGTIDHVIACLPDHKDVAGAIAELGDVPVTFVRLPERHLRFTANLPGHWQLIDADEMTAAQLAGLGGHIVALGTVYFTGRVLDVIDAQTEVLFTV
jgi:dihydrofolate synthase / folylpolyglutamate synthase